MTRILAERAGVSRTEIGDLVRVSFVKVAEFQTRGLVQPALVYWLVRRNAS
jgi:hypothetical protein